MFKGWEERKLLCLEHDMQKEDLYKVGLESRHLIIGPYHKVFGFYFVEMGSYLRDFHAPSLIPPSSISNL